MRDINHFHGDVSPQELTVCHSAALPISSYYGDVLTAYFLDMERRNTDSRTMDVQEMSLTAAELLVSAGIDPDDANICYIVRMAVHLAARKQGLTFDMRSFVSEDGVYRLTLTRRS